MDRLGGWFPIAPAGELAAGEVRTMKLGSRQLVCWRGPDVVHAIEAHCPHRGAHLGTASVTGSGAEIRCPFHGHLVAPDFGAESATECGAPGGSAPVHVTTSYPTCETRGLAWVWLDDGGRQPSWRLEELPELLGDAAHVASKEFELDAHVLDILENTIDMEHFPLVHGAPAEPSILDFVIDDHVMRCHTAHQGTRRGDRLHQIRLVAEGLGATTTRIRSIRA